MIKNIPRRADIDPAGRSRHRRHRRQTSEPLLSCANRLISSIRQHKINLRRNLLPINSQQPIRRRVRTGSMSRHSKPCIPPKVFAVFQWLKMLLLLMDTRPASPPPRLVYKRPMCRIHQPNNPVIDIARQIRRQMRRTKPPRKFRHLRHRRQLTQSPTRPSLWEIHPRKPIPLLTRIRTRINLRRIQRLVACQRGNLLALARTGFKPPPMILTSHRLPIEPSSRQWNPPVRTKIPHRKDLPTILPSHQQRHTQQQRRHRLAAAQLPSSHRRIPIPKDQLRRRSRGPIHLNKFTHHQSA